MKIIFRFLKGLAVVLCVLTAVHLAGPYIWPGKPKQQPLNTTVECLQGREAAMLTGGVIDTMNSPPKSGCPGYEDYSKGAIGTYKLGPYTFRIPRDYLWQGKYDEGAVEGLYMYIEYPSMKPAIEQRKKGGGMMN